MGNFPFPAGQKCNWSQSQGRRSVIWDTRAYASPARSNKSDKINRPFVTCACTMDWLRMIPHTEMLISSPMCSRVWFASQMVRSSSRPISTAYRPVSSSATEWAVQKMGAALLRTARLLSEDQGLPPPAGAGAAPPGTPLPATTSSQISPRRSAMVSRASLSSS